MSILKQMALVSCVFALTLNVANAAGFQLKEQSASFQGLSFAGATAKASDASTIFFNPAGMTRLKGKQAYANLSFIKPRSEFNTGSVTSATGAGSSSPSSSDNDGEDAGGLSVVPAFYAMSAFDNGVKFGISINTPFGLKTEYDDDWVGRYYAIKSELKTVNVSPNIAFKVNDKLSLGGGVQIQYAEAELTNAVNVASFLGSGADGYSKLEGDDFGIGYRLGALYELSERTRFGISYQSAIHHLLEGDVKIEDVGSLSANAAFKDADIQAKLKTPDVLSLGVYHAMDDEWSVLADVAWTNWSVFKYLRVINRDGGLVRQNVPEKWDDSYFTALGFEYQPKDCINRTYQFGVAYDTSAVGDEHRTFRIPDEDRFWMSLGYQQTWGENRSLHLGYSRIFVENAHIKEDASTANKGVVSGYLDGSVDILSLNYSWKF